MARFQTFQFPNTPQGQSIKVQTLEKWTSLGWRVVSETIIPGKFNGGKACCLFLVFPPFALLAGSSGDRISVTIAKDGPDSAANQIDDSNRIGRGNVEYDRQRWQALLEYDLQIAEAAEKIRPLGPRWMDEFAVAYMALNDTKYLPQIVTSIRNQANADIIKTLELNVRADAARAARVAQDEERLALDAKRLEEIRAARDEQYARWKYLFWGSMGRKIITVILCIVIVSILSVFLVQNAALIKSRYLGLGRSAQIGNDSNYSLSSNSHPTVSAPDNYKIIPQSVTPFERTSFNCTKAVDYAENTICHDTELAALDRKMAVTYSIAVADDSTGQVRSDQRAALLDRRDCQTRQCLMDWYSNRLERLSVFSGRDADICAHGDPDDYVTIAACDRKDSAASQSATQ